MTSCFRIASSSVSAVREVGEVLRDLYAPFLRTDKPFLVMSPESAEMTKYVANALLSTKISFINEMAESCARNWMRMSMTCGAGSGTTSASASHSCFPAWGTAEVVSPRMSAHWRRWPGHGARTTHDSMPWRR